MKKHLSITALLLIFLGALLPQSAEGQNYGGVNYGNEDSKAIVIYVVVKKVMFDGETSFAIMKKDEIKPLQETFAYEAKAISKAVLLVKKEWKKATPKVPFPRIAISASRIQELKTFTDEKKAKDTLAKYQKDWEKMETKKAEVLKKKLAKMDAKKKEKYETDQKLQNDAMDKIRAKIKEVLADMKAKENEKKKPKTVKK